MEILFPNANLNVPPSSEISLHKSKNVLPKNDACKPARKTQSLLDEIIGATCAATKSLVKV